jgi:hypothetical protein
MIKHIYSVAAILCAATVSAAAQGTPPQSKSPPAANPSQPSQSADPKSKGHLPGSGAKGPLSGSGADAPKPPTERDALQDCIGTWDAGARMTKQEWEATCRRTLLEHPSVLEATGLKEQGRRKP